MEHPSNLYSEGAQIYQTARQRVRQLREIMELQTAHKWRATLCMLMKWGV